MAFFFEGTSKARFLAGEAIAFCGEARPLQRIYFLGEGTASAVEFPPMGPSEALIELVRDIKKGICAR